jgi:hypothetical protein
MNGFYGGFIFSEPFNKWQCFKIIH